MLVGVVSRWFALPLSVGIICSSTNGFAAESRGYVISWFATATYLEQYEKSCPENRNGGLVELHIRELMELGYSKEDATDMVQKSPNPTLRPAGFDEKVENRARVNGKAVSIYSYPDAVRDPNLETVTGQFAYGFDLGGNNSASKFTDPETGSKVDNQLWRAVGCTGSFFAKPPAMPYPEEVAWNLAVDTAPAWSLQVVGDDLSKDGEVTVILDRLTQHLERDANGNILPGATYIVEPTHRSHNVLRGDMKSGVITVRSQDIYLEGQMPHYAEIALKKAQMRITPGADGKLVGYWGGYVDWKRFAYMYTGRPGNNADSIGIYHALKKMADAYPDPKTGQNSHISTAFRMEAVPAFIADGTGKILAAPVGTQMPSLSAEESASSSKPTRQ